MSLSGWMCCCHLALDVSVFVIMNCEIECEMWNACFLHSHLICFAITNKISQKKRLSRNQEKKLYEKIKNHPIHELTEISVYLVRCSHIFRVLFKRIMMCDSFKSLFFPCRMLFVNFFSFFLYKLQKKLELFWCKSNMHRSRSPGLMKLDGSWLLCKIDPVKPRLSDLWSQSNGLQLSIY